jgi:hypothetical protein
MLLPVDELLNIAFVCRVGQPFPESLGDARDSHCRQKCNVNNRAGRQQGYTLGTSGVAQSVQYRPALRHTQSPIQWAPGIKRPVREADPLPGSSAEVKMRGASSPLLHTSSWRGA